MQTVGGVDVGLLQQVDIFKSLPVDVLAKISSGVTLQKHRPGSIVCKVGDPATSMFVVLTGKLRVYLQKSNQGPTTLSLIEKDQDGPFPFFGETALVATQTFSRTANVKAEADTVLLEIPASIMQSMMDHAEAFYQTILAQAKANLERSTAAEERLRRERAQKDDDDDEATRKQRAARKPRVSVVIPDAPASSIPHTTVPPARPQSCISTASTTGGHRTHSRHHVEALMRSACLTHPSILARLDGFPWDPVTDTVQESTLLADAFLAPIITGSLAINDMPSFTAEVVQTFHAVREEVTEGHNASYIPILASVDPAKFAIAICTVSGQQWCYGDVNDAFSIQSSVKPYMYARGIEENGLKKMREHIGIEPSGLAFNAVTLNKDNRAHNPYGNAGAMTSASLIGIDKDTATRFNDFRSFLVDLAGGELIDFDMATYLCEWETAYRNNAILYTLTRAGAFPRGCVPREALDFYIQCCAIEVNVKSCAAMAATLAAGGECPLTKKKVMCPSTVKAVLTLMYSCGMYDYSGTWSQHVGVPAKSGVAGVIQMVWPNVAGVAIWSPPLDSRGNSVRGIEMSKRLCRRYHMSIFEQSIANMNGNLAAGGVASGEDKQRKKKLTRKGSGRGKKGRRSSIDVQSGSPAMATFIEAAAGLNNLNLTPKSSILSPSSVVTPMSDEGLGGSAGRFSRSLPKLPKSPPLEAPPGERLAAIEGSENNSPVAAEPPLYENNADEDGLDALRVRELVFERLHVLGDLVDAFKRLATSEQQHQEQSTGLKTSAPALSTMYITIDTMRAVLHDVGIGRERPVLLVTTLLGQIATNGRITFRSLFLRGATVEMNIIMKAMLGLVGIEDFNLFEKHIVEIYDAARPSSYCDASPARSRSLVNEFREDAWDLDDFGVAICTVDGQEIGLGDSGKDVPLMETIKPLLYALAMQDSGVDEVHKYVGIEPTSSDPTGFDLLSPTSHGGDDNAPPPVPTPYNPFTDSGGLVCCSMVGNGHKKRASLFEDKGTRFKHVLNFLRELAGGRGRLGFANPVFLAQKERGLQVKAVSHYIKGMGCYPDGVDPDSTAEQYFEARGIKTSCETLAAAAATIANGGVCPLTNSQCLDPDVVANTIRQMYSSGMNAFAGEWQFSVGIPASSGSSGLMLLVIPKVCGICVYDPQVNESLVPVRGIEFARRLTKRYRVNIFDQLVFGLGADPFVTNGEGDDDGAGGGAIVTSHDGLLIFQLLTAAGNGDVDAIRGLVEGDGLDVNVADYDNRTALHLACSDGKVNAARVLLELGADPMKLDRWRGTPLDDARRGGKSELVDLVTSFCTPA